jgi:hypothetical protein
MISDEYMMKAAYRMESAAERAERAADRMEESERRMKMLFEDGYGSNALKLIELLTEMEAKNGR